MTSSTPSLPTHSLPVTPKSPKSSAKPVTLKRLQVLYNELNVRDARSKFPWRLFILSLLLVILLYAAHLLFSTLRATLPAVQIRIPLPGARLYAKYDQMFYNDSDFAFIPDSDLFITTTAKAGSTAFWTWMHRGITGLPSFEQNCNSTYVQNFNAPCWLNKVVHPFNMSNHDRWRVINRPEVFRVAITRNPYERLISAWKSKVACDSDDFGTDVNDRDKIVPILVRQAGVRKDGSCLSLNSFAQVLERVRQLFLSNSFDIRLLNKHFRPQQCYFDEINYDVVLDIHQLADASKLKDIVERLKYKHLMQNLPPRVHQSRQTLHTMSEAAAARLYNFAVLTDPIPT